MGFVGKKPSRVALTSDDITDGVIVNADINASAAIAMSKTAFSAGNGVTLSTNTLNVDAAQTTITSLLATDIKIGEDDQTKIDFEDTNKINFYANNAKEVELAENSLSPGSSDGTALGTTSLMWSDLFLASGGVINLNDGDVTITHASGKLTSTGDLELLRDANNADVKVTLGTSAAESLIIQVLNGSSNKTAEEVHFSTATASGTADHGKMVFDIDGTDILTIDDGGLVIKTTGTIGPVGDEDLITLTASGNIVTVAGELSATTLDIGGTNITSTAGELNLLDGSAKSTSSITLADADAFIVIDGTTTKQIPASDISTYIGSGGGTTDLVADGSISAGDRVAITSAGKAKTVAALQTGVNNTTLTAIQNNGIQSSLDAAYSPDDDRFVVLFKDGGNGGATTAQVVDVDSNGDFSIGSEFVVDSSSGFVHEIEYDTNVNRFVTLHTGSDTLRSTILTVDTSDNSLGGGASLEQNLTGSGAFDADGTGSSAELVFDPDNNKMFAIYSQNDEVLGQVLTVSASSISVGTAADIHGTAGPAWYANRKGLKAAYDTAADRIVLCWQDSSDSNKMTSVVITISGTSFSVGSEVHVTETLTSDSNIYPDMIFDATSGKLVLFFYNGSQGDGEVYIGTCTGSSTNTCSWGSANVLVDGDGSYYNALFDAGGGNIVYAMEDRTKTNGTDLIQVGVGYVSGTSFISKQQQKMYTTYIDAAIQIVSGGTGNKIVLFTEDGTSLYGAVPDLPDNAGAFIGIANSAISDTATGTIQLHGTIATNQSSLSAGALYYLTSAGGLTTTATSYAKIGHALTSTTLLIQGTLPDAT